MLDHRRWIHVALAFGGGKRRALWIDGVAANEQPDSDCGAQNGPTNRGITGNQNPWVVGAGSWGSTEGVDDEVDSPLFGMIDNLRFSPIRRDAAPLP